MSFIADLLGGGSAIKAIGDVVDQFVTTDKERLELQIEREKAAQEHEYRMSQLDQQLNVAQTEVNKAEAQNSSLFVAGWRPAIGWVCGLALGYHFIVYPLLVWLALDRHPPQMDLTQLYPLIFGMLGIAGLRSYDKSQGTDTRKLGA